MDADRLNPDLSEALARGREPRKLWPVLHSVEGRADDAPVWWESTALWMFMTVLVLIAGAMLAKC